MDWNYVVALVKERQEDLKEMLKFPNERLEFFDRVVSENNFSSLSGILKINVIDIKMAYLLTISDKITPNQLNDIFSKGYLEMDADRIFELIEDENISLFGAIKTAKKILDDCNLAKELIISCYGEKYGTACAIEDALNRIKDDYDFYRDDVDDFINGNFALERVSNKKRKNLVYDRLKHEYNLDELNKYFVGIEKCYKEIESNDKAYRKNIKKAIFNYDELIKILSNLSIDKVLSVNTFNNIINLIENDTILREVFQVLDLGLEEYFDDLNNEYNLLSFNRENGVKAIFNKYNIEFDDLDVNTKNKMFDLNDQEIELFLVNISNFGAVEIDFINYILVNSNNDVISSIISMIKQGILTFDFVLNNKYLLSVECYNELINKIELLKKYGVNPLMFVKNLDIYLVDTNLLDSNFNILRQYNLLGHFSKLDEFKFIDSEDLDIKIDLLLELGYENILENNLNLLSSSIYDIRKLYVLKNLGMLPMDIDGINKVLSNNDYLSYVDDSYLFNVVEYRVDGKLFGDNLRKFYSDFVSDNSSRVLEFEGVYLSKNRIKRNMVKLENINMSDEKKLIYSLVYGAILSEEEYNVIFNKKDSISKKLYF